MAFLEFAEVVGAIEDWAYLILVAAAIWYFILMLRGGDEGREEKSKAWGFGQKTPSEAWKSVKDATGRTAHEEKKKVEKLAKREKTKLLSEYIEEEKELGLLEDVSGNLNDFTAVVTSARSSGLKNKEEIKTPWDALHKAAEEAGKEVRRLKRATFREQRKSKDLMNELRKAGVKDANIEKVKAEEAQILLNHKKLIEGLGAFEASLGVVGKNVKVINDSKKTFPLNLTNVPGTGTTGPKLADLLNQMDTPLSKAEGQLQSIIKLQGQSYKDVKGLIAAFQKYWKPE